MFENTDFPLILSLGINNEPLLFDSLEIRYFRAFDFLKIERLGHINLILRQEQCG